jgi:hypothetical protein
VAAGQVVLASWELVQLLAQMAALVSLHLSAAQVFSTQAAAAAEEPTAIPAGKALTEPKLQDQVAVELVVKVGKLHQIRQDSVRME